MRESHLPRALSNFGADIFRTPATRLIEALENRSLRFTFTVRTVETTVLVELAGIDGGTQMVIVQDKVPRPDTEASLEDFWGLSLENLRRLLTGGSGPLFRDFRERARGQAVVSAQIDGAPAKVFDALINPAELDRYVATKAVVEPVTGGKVDFGWGGGPIKILEVERDRKLSYSWQHGAEPETVVTWTLEGSAGGTRLTLVHSGFGADRITDDYTTGWLYFVSSMKSMIGMGPSWRRANVHTSQHA
jgi:uncharacterized protein YndB with AHSA1/START domain